MYKLLVIVTLVVCCAAVEYTLENCKCGEGYEPSKDTNGKVQCTGIRLLHIKPCNLPDVPKCACSEEVTGIMSDKDGTWCTFSENGVNKKKWACENKEEWSAYKKQFEEYLKTVRQQ